MEPVEHETNEDEKGSAEDASEKSLAENTNDNNTKAEAISKSRMSILSSSRLSTMFDPTIISTWITGAGTDQQTKAQKRTTRVLDNTLKVGLESIRLSTAPDLSLFIEDGKLDDAFENLLDEMNIHGHHRNKMLEMSEDHKRTLIIQNRQAQAVRKSQQDNIAREEEEKSRQDSEQKDIMEYNGDIGHEKSSRNTQIRDSESSIASVTENDVEQRLIEQPLMSTLLNTEPVPIPSLEERINSPSSGGFFSSWIPVFGFSTSSAKSQDTPDFYVEKLTQRNIAAKSLAERLQSLRVTLSTAKLSWIKNFIDCKGLAALEFVLERYTIGVKKNMTRNTDHDDRIQSECVRCLRVLLNTELGYSQVLKSPSLINCIVFCMHTTNNKLRSQVADVLAALCVLSLEGHKLVLDSFSDFRQVHEEKFRFQYLMDTLKTGETEDSVSMEYKSACLSLVNAIVTSPEDVEERMMLRKEFERRGLTELFLKITFGNTVN